MTQDDTACDRDCMHCNPVDLATHINRKRARERNTRKRRDTGKNGRRRAKMGGHWMPAGVKQLESGRNRAHLRDQLKRDPDGVPKRDTPSRRWDLWRWD